MWKFLILSITCFLANSSHAQVVITELMADPTPVVGLPDNEWIELKNTSGSDVSLLNYRLRKPGFSSGAFPAYLLKKDSFVIVAANSNLMAMSAYGSTIGITGFPSLINGGDLLYLENAQGQTIHAIQYRDDWYQNPLKKEGGWSLEMIDPANKCGHSNWSATIDPRGGTPGKTNSINRSNPDQTPPSLLYAYLNNPQQAVLVFSEFLDSSAAAIKEKYIFSDGISSPSTALPQGPTFDRVLLNLPTAVQRNKVYTISINSVTDCAGNIIGVNNQTRIGIAQAVDSQDIIINEILSHPKSSGTDYVEIFNRSNKIIDLKDLYLANRNTASQIANIVQLTTTGRLIFPGDYMVLTENSSLVLKEYISENPGQFMELNMPSFNNSSGNVVLLNKAGTIVDEVSYSEKWHFPLIVDPTGVSLERIDPNAPGNNANNWTSASSSVGFGTPGYKNSQFLAMAESSGKISLSPKVISPDNDGNDDFLTISYKMPEGGYVANVTIFDAAGRPVRYLVKNGLMGVSGSFRWDGTGDKLQKLPVGIYVVFTEVFNKNGRTKQFKNVVVVARRS